MIVFVLHFLYTHIKQRPG